jgi:predicted O-methyltransferase YrrM
MSTETNPTIYDGYHGPSWMKTSELAKLIELLPPHGMMLEIGSADGVTAAKIAEAHPGSRVVSVDPFPDANPDRLNEWDQRLLNWRRNQRANQHLWVSQVDIFHLLCKEKFDLVLVDGEHRYATCASDLMYAVTLLAPNGVLAIHDYALDEFYQVSQATDRFLADHAELKLMEVVSSLAVIKKVV